MSDKVNEVSDAEAKYLEGTKILMGMDEVGRNEYVAGVVVSLVGTIKTIKSAKGKIAQAKLLKKFGKEMEEKGEELVVCALYTMKPEFREVWMKVMGELVGIEEQVVL